MYDDCDCRSPGRSDPVFGVVRCWTGGGVVYLRGDLERDLRLPSSRCDWWGSCGLVRAILGLQGFTVSGHTLVVPLSRLRLELMLAAILGPDLNTSLGGWLVKGLSSMGK